MMYFGYGYKVTTMNKKHPINRKKLPSLIENAYQRAKSGDERGIERLRYYLEGEEIIGVLKYEIAEKLYRLHDPVGILFVEDGLTSSSFYYRYEIAFTLVKHGHDNVRSILVEGLGANDLMERYLAAQFLGRLGDKRAINILIEAYEQFKKEIRNVIYSQLVLYGDPGWDIAYFFKNDKDAIHAMYKCLNTDSDSEMDDTLEIIAYMDQEGTMLRDLAFPLLGDKNEDIRKKITSFIINHYITKINIESIIYLEDQCTSCEVRQLIDIWLDKQ